MNTNDHIEKRADDALNSLDGAERASAKPFLYTRMMARMQRKEEGSWEKAVRFIARPAVAFAGLCLIVCINVAVIAYNNTASGSTSEPMATADEFTTSATTLYYADNTEP